MSTHLVYYSTGKVFQSSSRASPRVFLPPAVAIRVLHAYACNCPIWIQNCSTKLLDAHVRITIRYLRLLLHLPCSLILVLNSRGDSGVLPPTNLDHKLFSFHMPNPAFLALSSAAMYFSCWFPNSDPYLASYNVAMPALSISSDTSRRHSHPNSPRLM